MASPEFIVFAILAAVAAAAIMHQPKDFPGLWKRLLTNFGTTASPQRYTFERMSLAVNSNRFLPLRRGPFEQFGTFDAAVDEQGLWLKPSVSQNPEPPASVFIPWEKIEPNVSKRAGPLELRLATTHRDSIIVPDDLGMACWRHLERNAR